MKDYDWTDCLLVAHAAARAIGGSMERIDVDVDTELAKVLLSHPHEKSVWVEVQLCPNNEWWQVSGPLVLSSVDKRDAETAGRIAGQTLRRELLDLSESEHIRNAEHRLIDPALTDTPDC